MKKNASFIILFALLFGSNLSYAQSCNCLENYNWMVKTFEENDAGFQYVIDKKGKDYYEDFKRRLTAKVSDTLNPKDCILLMKEYSRFFRGGHIQLNWNRSFLEFVEQTVKKATNKITNEFYSEKEILKIIEKKSNPHFLEGIWFFPEWNTKFGVLQDEKNKNKFSFYKIEYDVDFEEINILFEVKFNNTNKNYTLNNLYKSIYDIDLSVDTIKKALYFTSKGVEHFFVKVPNPKVDQQAKNSTYQFFISSHPYFEKLTRKTLYLRIPSFRYENKLVIDSLLKKNDSLIQQFPNLIIDIRNGTGGSDDSYAELLPYINTNQTHSIGQQYFATELNAKGYDFYAEMIQDSLSKATCQLVANEMRKNRGKFIDVDFSAIYSIAETSHPKLIKYDNPKQVAIICNKNNGSTDEAFLMDARQSKKVKIFGSTTGGMLDISNLNCINSPDGKLYFCYGMTKSYRIPDFCIDDVGIQPDIYYQGIYSEVEWVDKVLEYLEN